MTSTVTDSRQAVTVAALALRETLTFAESLGLTPGWTDESTLTLHWRHLTGSAGLSVQRQRKVRPIGRPLVAVGVACALANAGTTRMRGYIAINQLALEHATWRQLQPIYEALTAVTMGINYAQRFAASFIDALNDEREGSSVQRWPLSQVVVLARGEQIYLEPFTKSLR